MGRGPYYTVQAILYPKAILYLYIKRWFVINVPMYVRVNILLTSYHIA